MSGGGAEARNATLAEMVGEARYVYPRDNNGEHSSRYGGGDGYG